MALKIKENNGTFFITGSINATTVKQFKNHVEFLILYTKGLTLDVSGISYIDQIGIHALKALHIIARESNKDFLVIRKGSRQVFQDVEKGIAA